MCSSIGFANLELITGLKNRNRDFRIIDSNPAFEKIAGQKREHITGKTIRELFTPDETGSSGWSGLCDRIAPADGAAEFEYFFESSEKWYRVHVHCTDNLNITVLFVDITGQKKSEFLLQINEKDLRGSQRISQVGSWRLDINTNQVTWTEELYKMYGFDPSLPPPPYTEHMKLFTAESWERLSKALANTRETGIPYTLELETVRKDGSNGWMWVHGEADVDQAGKILSLWGAAQDITRRKTTEAQLIETEQRLRLANRATRDVIWDWDIETDTQHWNEAGKLVFGWTEIVDGPVNAQWWVERVHPEDRQRVHDSFFKVVNDPELEIWNDEYRFLKSDGSYANVLDRGYVLRNQEGKATRMIGAMLDITGRKRVEQDLKRSEHVLRLFVEHSPAAIAMFDREMRYMITSQRYLSDFRLDKQHLAGLSHYDVFPEMTEVHKNIHRRCLEGFVEKNNEDFLPRHDGTIDWVKWELRPWYEDNGEIGGLIFFSEVITEQKKAADEIRWLNEDLQLINAVTNAANQGEDLETIVNTMAFYLKAYFNTHLVSLFLPNAATGNLEMFGNTLAPELLRKIEKIIRRPIPRVSLNPKTKHPFSEIAETGKGILSVGKSEVIERLAGYLHGTSWPAVVQKVVKSLLPVLYDVLEYKSTAAVAMKVDGEILGFFEFGSKKTMSLHDLERIQSYADHLATVITKIEAEKKRKESEERMSIAFNHASIGMVIVSPQGRIQRANPSMVNILGFTEKELLGKAAIEISHPEDLKKDRIYINQMLEGVINNYQTEKRYIHKTGKVIWAILSITLVRDSEGKPLYFISQVQDITERKINEEKIKESENRFRRIFESVQEVYFEASMDGTLLEVSPSIEKIAKGLYSRDEMIGNSFVEVYADPFARDLYFARLMEQKSVSDYELWLKNKDGSIFPVTVSSVMTFDEKGKPERIVGIIRDISERKQAEQALRNSEEQFRSAFEYSSIGIALVSPEGRWLKVNSSVCTMLGYTEDELLSKTFQDITLPEDLDADLAFVEQMLAGSILTYQMEKRYVHKSGTIVWAMLSVSLVHDHEGKPLHFISQIQDITNRKMAEIDVRESEKKYRMLFETMAQGVVYQDSLGRIVSANRAAEEILGLTLDQMQGRTSVDPRWQSIREDGTVFPGEEHPAMISLKTGKASSAVMGVHNPAIAQDRWINVVAIPEFRDGESTPYQVFATFDDITELKTALDELNKSKVLLEVKVEERTKEILKVSGLQKAILKNAPLAILTSDPEGTFLSINPAGEKMLGYTANEIIGKQNPLFFHDMPEMIEFCRKITGNSHPSEEEIYQTALQNMFQRTTEWTWVRKNGEKFPVRITHSTITDDNGTLLGYMGLIIDISEERKAISDLLESEERFHNMFYDHASIMLLIHPESGEIIEANKSAEQFYDIAFNSGTKRHITEINELPEQSIHAEISNAFSSRQNVFVFNHKIRSGEIRTVEVHSTPIEFGGKKILFSIIHDITDRIVAESALKKSEIENRAIIQAVPDLMFRIRRDGTYLDAHFQNDSSLYVPKEVFIGKKISEILPPNLAEQSMNSIEKAFATGKIDQYEYSLPVHGNDRYFENRITAITDDEVLSIIRDITLRKESETALQMQSAAFESFALAIIITDIYGYIQWSNSAFTRLTGYSNEEAKGKTPGQLVKSGKQNKIFYKDLWDTILEKKVWTGELINKKKDGTLYYEEQSITPVMNPRGEIANFISIKIDITERKQMETALRKSEERMKLAFLAAQDGIWDWNIENDEVFYSARYKMMLGYEEDELDSHADTWKQLMHPDDVPRALQVVKDVLDRKREYVMEFRMQHKDGHYVDILSRGFPICREPDGPIVRIVGTHHDLTERNRAAESLRHANAELERALRIKDEFLASMSHELRTPLSAILGISESLADQIHGPVNERQLRAVRTIETSGRHLLELISDILDLSKFEARQLKLDFTSVHVADVCETSLLLVRELALKKNIQLNGTMDPQVQRIHADNRRLRQMLINLLNNAVKFTPDGGTVELKVTGNPVDQTVSFAVIDTGIGIAPEDLGRLFQPFVQLDSGLNRQYEGSGLGLALVDRMARLHGGEVTVHSEPGKGSRFTILLPWSGPMRSSADRATIQEGPGSGNGRPANQTNAPLILIAEDNEGTVEMLTAYLDAAGYRTEVARNGLEALEKARQYRPALILMDLQMPVMDGLEATRQLRNDDDPALAATPVIALTALAMPGDRERSLEAGATEYMSKPFSMREMAERIRITIEQD